MRDVCLFLCRVSDLCKADVWVSLKGEAVYQTPRDPEREGSEGEGKRYKWSHLWLKGDCPEHRLRTTLSLTSAPPTRPSVKQTHSSFDLFPQRGCHGLQSLAALGNFAESMGNALHALAQQQSQGTSPTASGNLPKTPFLQAPIPVTCASGRPLSFLEGPPSTPLRPLAS